MSNSVNLALDVTKTGIQNPLIKVRQGDGGFETLHTTVTSNGEPLDLQGWTITFMGTTAGNHKIVDGNVTIIEAPNGIFDYTPSKAWGMDIGEFKMAYFKFVKGDGSASSANFRVSVIEAVDLTQEDAQNYISVVDNLIEQTRQDLTNSLADVTTSIAATSSAASSMAVYVSSTADSAANKVNVTASSAVSTINTAASSAVNQVNSAAASASSVASSAADKVSGVAAQVNSLSVGGRNLYLNSRMLADSYGANGNVKVTIEPFDSTTNMWHVVAAQGSGSNVGIYIFNYALGKIPNNSDWSYSVDIKGTGSVSQLGIEYSDKSPIKGTVGSEWSRIIQTGHVGSPNTKTIVMYFDTTDSPLDVYIKLPKLETGNLPTDWTPAPEDVPSNDAQLVHKIGTETIAGDKTFTGVAALTSVKSSNIKTGSVTLNGLTIDFRQTVVGVNVYMHGTFAGTFGTDQSYVTSSSVVPTNIDNPKQTVVLTIISNGGVSGITNNSPWELEVLITATGAIQYRAKNLRDNDITARNTSIVGASSAFYTIE